MVLKLMMNAASAGKMTQSIILLSIVPLPNCLYKKSFGGLMQRTTHISLQLLRKFYSELILTQMRRVPSIDSTTLHYLCATLSIVVN